MEILKKTLPLEDAQGWHLLESQSKTWIEDFTDEDTGEAVRVERSEVILHKGCKLTAKRKRRISSPPKARVISNGTTEI